MLAYSLWSGYFDGVIAPFDIWHYISMWNMEGVNSGWLKTGPYIVHSVWNYHQHDSLQQFRRHKKSVGTLGHHLLVFWSLMNPSKKLYFWNNAYDDVKQICVMIMPEWYLLNNNKQLMFWRWMNCCFCGWLADQLKTSYKCWSDTRHCMSVGMSGIWG